MTKSILFQFELARNFLLFGFGVYSLVYILINVLKINWPIVRVIDKSALRLAAFIGLFYAMLWLINIMLNLEFYKMNTFGIEENEYTFAYYWATYWLLNFCWVFAPLLLWLKAISQFIILRFIILIFFLVSFDEVILLISSYQQDFLMSRIKLLAKSGLTIVEVMAICIRRWVQLLQYRGKPMWHFNG